MELQQCLVSQACFHPYTSRSCLPLISLPNQKLNTWQPAVQACFIPALRRLDRVYPLVMLSDVSKAVAEAAQSQLEFMSDSVGKVECVYMHSYVCMLCAYKCYTCARQWRRPLKPAFKCTCLQGVELCLNVLERNDLALASLRGNVGTSRCIFHFVYSMCHVREPLWGVHRGLSLKRAAKLRFEHTVL